MRRSGLVVPAAALVVALVVALAGVAGCGERRGAAPARPDTLPPSREVPGAAPSDSAAAAWPVLDDSGAGCLHVGMPVAAVRSACRVVSEATRRGAEGMPERRLVAAIGPDTLTDTVAATIVRDTVWRIEVTGAALRTTDSLGVGTPLRRLLSEPGAQALGGEGNLVVTVPRHCGLSFQLATTPGQAAAASADAAVRSLPPATPVRRVLVVGCHRR